MIKSMSCSLTPWGFAARVMIQIERHMEWRSFGGLFSILPFQQFGRLLILQD